MVGFGNKLQNEAHAPWRAQFIDYECLKRLVDETTIAKKEASERPETAGALQAKKSEFQRFLDSEVQKVLAFYKSKSQELQQSTAATAAHGRALLQQLQSSAMQPDDDRVTLIDGCVQEVQRATDEITHLLQYVSLNMVSIRKILKKYGKHVELLPPRAGFMALEVAHPYEDQKLVQGTLLPDSLAAELAEMQRHQPLLQAAEDLAALYADAKAYRDRLGRQPFMRLPSFGTRLLSGLAHDIRALHEAEEAAARNAALVHGVPWVERAAGMFEPPPPDIFAVATTSGLVLNNLSALLFMANYTAVLPPTERLCRHIGISTSWTGAIMAASDAAAIFTSVGISFWTQRSFKQPLLFASAACFVGNVVFVLSYQFRSLPLLLASRMLNGLGSARTANRRYTADYVSRQQRTLAAAAFVGCSNLGQALGPFLSLPLALLPDYHVAGVPVNPVTAVGWAMAALWMLFFVLTVVYFQEPAKSLPIGLASASMAPAGWQGQGRDTAADDASLAQPLLSNAASGLRNGQADEEQPAASQVLPLPPPAASGASAWWPTVPATLACVACLFVQKAVQQAYMDGVPLFTSALSGWRLEQNSLFLGLVGLAMAPVNVAVGVLSSRVSDRTMVVFSVIFTIASLLVMIAAAVSPAAYFAGGVSLFMSTVVLEGTATSLMSKVIWSGLARGVLNAGLLSTEAGTLGRFSGNALLTLVGRATGVEDAAQLRRFAEILHGTLAGVCGLLLVQLVTVHRRLGG